jgi:heptosyltransferase-2
MRFNIISRFSKIPEVYQYPLFQKSRQHITDAPRQFMKDKLDLVVDEDPEVHIDNSMISKSIKRFQINKNEMNILLGIGGSGPTKRIPSHIFLSVIEKILKVRKCKFFLATGKDNEEQIILNEILDSNFKDLCIPLDNFSIKETLPIIKSCDLSICNDSSFSHLSAALGIKTITLMADTPLVYGNYSSKMFPIIPDGEETVTHNMLGKEKINPQKIFNKIVEIMN